VAESIRGEAARTAAYCTTTRAPPGGEGRTRVDSVLKEEGARMVQLRARGLNTCLKQATWWCPCARAFPAVGWAQSWRDGEASEFARGE
jgi:hypothetical protein